MSGLYRCPCISCPSGHHAEGARCNRVSGPGAPVKCTRGSHEWHPDRGRALIFLAPDAGRCAWCACADLWTAATPASAPLSNGSGRGAGPEQAALREALTAQEASDRG